MTRRGSGYLATPPGQMQNNNYQQNYQQNWGNNNNSQQFQQNWNTNNNDHDQPVEDRYTGFLDEPINQDFSNFDFNEQSNNSNYNNNYMDNNNWSNSNQQNSWEMNQTNNGFAQYQPQNEQGQYDIESILSSMDIVKVGQNSMIQQWKTQIGYIAVHFAEGDEILRVVIGLDEIQGIKSFISVELWDDPIPNIKDGDASIMKSYIDIIAELYQKLERLNTTKTYLEWKGC